MHTRIHTALLALTLCAFAAAAQAEEKLRPFVLGNTPTGDMAATVQATKRALAANGFQVLGSYVPYQGATVICATNGELRATALKTENGGFGAVERVAVTNDNGTLEVSYVNPVYMGIAYGMGELPQTTAALAKALGAQKTFGAEGLDKSELGPQQYHYAIGMPYFFDVDLVETYPDHKTAVDTIERNLDLGKGGTQKVYRLDLSNDVTVFGVGITTGDGIGKGDRDTDTEIMQIIDYKSPRSTAYLPYELMVTGDRAIALAGRYRIAVYFPDTRMFGAHGFTKIMSAPDGILNALTAVAEKKKASSDSERSE